MEISTVIILCILCTVAGAGIAAAAVYRDMSLKVARMRRDGYIMNSVNPERPDQNEPWLDIPEG